MRNSIALGVLLAVVAVASLAVVVIGLFGGPRSEGELVFYCAGGLRAAGEGLARGFEERTGVRSRMIYSNSGVLLSQLAMKRAGDLYLAGDAFFMEQARERGLIESHETVAYFLPVVAVAKGNPHGVKGIADLAGPGLRVGLGEEESTSVGRAAKRVLGAEGLWDEVVGRRTMAAATVNELGNALKLGAIDAAIMWDAVARQYGEAVEIVAVAGAGEHIAIPLGVLSFSEQKDVAREFSEFARSEDGRRIFRECLYTVELPAPADVSQPE
jgi:molybdate transport system substrate-binding protein